MNLRLAAFLGSAAIFASDRLTKLWILGNVGLYETWTIIPGFFDIIRAENTGMAFSLLSDAPEVVRKVLLIGLAVIVMGFVAVMLWQAAARKNERLQTAALSLVLGGALGNLYDRILRGSVTDFLDFYAGSYHWPTFNIADSAITVGALMLVTSMWSGGRAKK